MQQLLEMLTYKRPHLSNTEVEFITKYLEPLQTHDNVQSYTTDDAGNIFVSTNLLSHTLFTAHVDTVHSKDGKQVVTYDKNIQLVYLDDKAALATNCLGADDTAGMWLMLEMIDAGVPGTYAFFRGEERGGIGSSHAAKTDPEFFKFFHRAIAFDRRSDCSVITHQGYGRCCSDDFAAALATAINGASTTVTLRPDSTGVFTDTANLTDLIGECTNVSCGYDAEHSVNESLDLEYLQNLRDALLLVDFEQLPTKRKPGEDDPADYHYRGAWWTDYDKHGLYVSTDTKAVMRMRYSELVKWVRKNSVEDIAEVISELVDQIDMMQEEQLDYGLDNFNHLEDAA